MYVHGSQFGAAVQGGYGLAGIEQSGGIESIFQGMKLFQLRRIELLTHRIDFLHPNAVLTGNRTACCDAHAENFSTEFLSLCFSSPSRLAS